MFSAVKKFLLSEEAISGTEYALALAVLIASFFILFQNLFEMTEGMFNDTTAALVKANN